MSNTPSMTPKAALAAALKQCGPRHAATINSKNRGAVRKWLIAEGVPNAYVQMFTLEDLRGAYGDITDATVHSLIYDAASVAASRKISAALDALDELSNGLVTVDNALVTELINRAEALITPKVVVTPTQSI